MRHKASLMDFVTHFEIMPLSEAYFGLFADDDLNDRSMTVTAPAVDDLDDLDDLSLIGE